MEDKKDENEFPDYLSGKDKVSKPDLVAEAWRDVRKNRAVEMRRGYYNFKTDKLGNESKNWVPDTREVYINNVIALDVMVDAEAHTSNKNHIEDAAHFREVRKLVLSKIDNLLKKWGWRLYRIKTTKGDLYNSYEKIFTGEIIMPELQQRANPKTGAYANVIDVNSEGEEYFRSWDNEYHQYMSEMVLIYDDLMRAIGGLLLELNYIGEGTTTN